MKTMKRMAALVLCLSLLIGLPFAVQAVGTSTTTSFDLHAIYKMNDKMKKAYNATDLSDYTLVPYFNSSDKWGWQAKGNVGTAFEMFVEPYDAEGNVLGKANIIFNAVNYYNTAKDTDTCYTWVGGSGSKETYKRVPLLQFEDTTQGFSYWKEQKGAVGYRFVILEKDGQVVNDHINGWKTSLPGNDGTTLTATDVYGDGTKDAVVREVILLENNDYLHLNTVTRISDSKLLLKFSEPVAMAELKANGGPVNIELHETTQTGLGNNAPNDTATYVTKWEAISAKVLGSSEYVEVTFNDGAVAEAFANKEANGTGLWLQISENNTATIPVWGHNGEQVNNNLIDGIWATADKEPLFAISGKYRDSMSGDFCYYWPTSKELPNIWSEQGVYTDLITALDAAQEGNTVHLGAAASVDDRFMEVPAGVTLDLHGKNLTVKNIFSFGDIIDSTDGNGGLVISNNKTVAFVGLQEDNASLPLYDAANGCYRFYECTVTGFENVKTDNPVTYCQFGINVLFNNQTAYKLLAEDANAELSLDITVGEQEIPYSFKQTTMEGLRDLVTEDAASWNNRTKAAIALTISGLDAYDSTPSISVAPTLTSTGVARTAAAITYTSSN